MNSLKNKIKQSISLMIIFALIFSFIAPITSFEVDAAENINHSINVRIEGKDSTFVKPTNVKIDSLDLSDYPGIEKSASDYDSLKAIHAIIKALEKTGIDPKNKEKFNISSGGNYITMVNGLEAGETSGWMFRVDNKNADAGAGDYEIEDGQQVTMFYVEDWSDNTYSWFENESITTEQDQDFQLQLKGHAGYDETTANIAIEDATILVDGSEYKENGRVIKTDSQGKISLNLKDQGTYHISAIKKNDKGQNTITRPYALIKVEKAKDIQVNTIKSIEKVKDIKVNLKTSKEKAISKLAKTTNIIDSSGKKHSVDLNWTLKEYSSQRPGQYEAIGSFTLPQGLVQTDPPTKLQLAAKLIVKEEKILSSKDLDKAIKQTVNYYKKNNPQEPNGDWEAYVGLWGVDGIIEKAYDWESIDQEIESDTSGNDTLTHAYSLLAKGKDPSNIWGGRNLLQELASQQREDGVFTNIGKHIFSMVLLDSSKEIGLDVGTWNQTNRQRAIDGLLKKQNKDGSFGPFAYLDNTGWSLIALSKYKDQEKVEQAIDKAVEFLKSKQTDKGGFDYNDGFEKGENSNSISAIIQGLVAIEEDLTLNGPWVKNGNTPLDALLAYQQDDGSFLWKLDSTITGPATKQAIVALSDLKGGKSTWHRLGQEIDFSIAEDEYDKDDETIEEIEKEEVSDEEKTPIVDNNKDNSSKDSNSSNNTSSQNSPKTGDEGILSSIILFIGSLSTILFVNKKRKIKLK